MQIVSNTSPLSNLAAIDEVGLLQQIYPAVLIPPAVYTELMNFSQIQPKIVKLIESSWLSVKAPANIQLVSTLEQTLDPGEAAAIALAIEINADRLLVDERLGRRIAAQYRLEVRGVIGILVNAKNQGLIPATKPVLDQLISEAGFRLSRTLYIFALRQSGEL